MKISHIVAIDRARGIGYKGGIPWKISEDLKRFKSLTDGHCIVMGRGTFESIGKPLKNRVNIVISSTMTDIEGLKIVKSWPEAKALALSLGEKELFVIGGQTLYYETLPDTTNIYMTLVHRTYTCDRLYPINENTKMFTEVSTGKVLESEEGTLYQYLDFERI